VIFLRFPYVWGPGIPKGAAPAPVVPPPVRERSRQWQVVASFEPVSWDHAQPQPMAYQRIEAAVASAWTALELPRTLWSKV